jgi:hypothetical protein
MCWLMIAGRFLALECISGENSLQSVFGVSHGPGFFGKYYLGFLGICSNSLIFLSRFAA